VRGQRRQAIILEIVTKYLPNTCRLLKGSYRPSGLQARDCVMKRLDGIRETKVDIGKANCRYQKKVLDNLTRAK
jgi:hypothetical protein